MSSTDVAPRAVNIGRVQVSDLGRFATAGGVTLRALRGARNRKRGGEKLAPAVVAELRTGFEHLGPTYVKLGQMIASTPGLFPPVLCEGFRGCLDEVQPLDIATIRQVITSELGDRPEALFATFDEKPLASASIGQVHRATTHDGREVVVKVQRPGIADYITRDLRILHLAARMAERVSKIARLAQPVAIAEDFAVTLSQELSFMIEARSMEALTEAFADFDRADTVRIPAVDWRLTTPKVLTMEFVSGTRFDDVDALDALGVDTVELLKNGVQAWLHGALVHGVFHGDLHAGNLMVDDAGRATFLDFGICGWLDTEARRSLLEALPALMGRDMRRLAAVMFLPGAPGLYLDAITVDMDKAILPIIDQPIAEVSYATAFIELVRIGIRYRVRLPRELILVFKQFFYVERFSMLLAPDWSPLLDPSLLDLVILAQSRLDETDNPQSLD